MAKLHGLLQREQQLSDRPSPSQGACPLLHLYTWDHVKEMGLRGLTICLGGCERGRNSGSRVVWFAAGFPFRMEEIPLNFGDALKHLAIQLGQQQWTIWKARNSQAIEAQC